MSFEKKKKQKFTSTTPLLYDGNYKLFVVDKNDISKLSPLPLVIRAHKVVHRIETRFSSTNDFEQVCLFIIIINIRSFMYFFFFFLKF